MEATKPLITIPAYNEEECIGEVIARVKQGAPFADPVLDVQDKWIVVINDGSSSGTAMQTGYIFADEIDYDIAMRKTGMANVA